MRASSFLTMSSVLAGLALGGCTGGAGQVLHGRAELTSFPSGVTGVRVLRGRDLVASAPVAADGTFRVSLPPGTGYRLELAAASPSTLVFPRRSGRIDSRFDLRSAGVPFELGTIRWVGDAASRTYAFLSSAGGGSASDGGYDVECEDGVDASGAPCIDDGAQPEEEACAEGDEDEADDVDCEDGVDSVSGLGCDGGPGANGDDGAGAAEEPAERDGSEPSDGAIADHNLPSVMGCAARDGEDDEDAEGGREAD